ncbi:MAG TPA: molecular chaperone HtpG, partial [Spirochaetes bacterium]|nr:molecular chaperone HtpG [Spirochaetota bacterium]
QKIMKAYNKDTPESKRIMEINPDHQLIEKMKGLFETNKDEPRLKDYAELLYDQALIAEGSKIPDPVQFNERLSNLMLQV